MNSMVKLLLGLYFFLPQPVIAESLNCIGQVFENFEDAVSENTFKTERDFYDYRKHLGSEFENDIKKLNSSKTIVDSGAGQGLFLADLADSNMWNMGKKQNVNLIGLSLKRPMPTNQSQKILMANRLIQEQRIHYYEMAVQDYALEHSNSAHMVVDVWGPASYAPFDDVLKAELEILKTKGVLYIHARPVRILDRLLRPMNIAEFLNRNAVNIQVKDLGNNSLKIKKLDKSFKVPALKMHSQSFAYDQVTNNKTPLVTEFTVLGGVKQSLFR